MKLAAAACMEEEEEEDGGWWWWWPPWWLFIIPKEMFISCCCSLKLPPLAMAERGARPVDRSLATAGARRHGLRAGGVRVYISPAGAAAVRP